jgi:hypothetical protein
MRDIAVESGCQDSTHHAIPLDFLFIVQFVPAGDTAGVKVRYPLDVFLDRGYLISFHNLHVVDVVDEFYVGRIYFLHCTHTPGRVIAHIVGMIYFAVQ